MGLWCDGTDSYGHPVGSLEDSVVAVAAQATDERVQGLWTSPASAAGATTARFHVELTEFQGVINRRAILSDSFAIPTATHQDSTAIIPYCPTLVNVASR